MGDRINIDELPNDSPDKQSAALEAVCPGCHKVGYVEGLGGWVFNCSNDHCDYPGWGHPQITDTNDARGCVAIARQYSDDEILQMATVC